MFSSVLSKEKKTSNKKKTGWYKRKKLARYTCNNNKKNTVKLFTSGGSINLSTASDNMKNDINNKNKLLTNPARTSALTYPYEYFSFAFHFVITDAAKPASSPVQSKNIWNESDMRPTIKILLEKLKKKHEVNRWDNKKHTQTIGPYTIK